MEFSLASMLLTSHQDGTLAKRAIRTQFLVIDEADRMIEAGHFEEMDKILRMTQRTSK